MYFNGYYIEYILYMVSQPTLAASGHGDVLQCYRATLKRLCSSLPLDTGLQILYVGCILFLALAISLLTVIRMTPCPAITTVVKLCPVVGIQRRVGTYSHIVPIRNVRSFESRFIDSETARSVNIVLGHVTDAHALEIKTDDHGPELR